MISMRLALNSSNILFFDPQIECIFHHLRMEQRQVNMAEPQRRTLDNFTLTDITKNSGGIVAPTIANNNFEIKLSVI